MGLEGGSFLDRFYMKNTKLVPNDKLKKTLGGGGSIHLTSSFEGENEGTASSYQQSLELTLNRSLQEHGIPGNIIITLIRRLF